MWNKALFPALYLAASIRVGDAKDLPSALPQAVRAQIESFLKCSAATAKARARDQYCDTKLHIPPTVVPEMRRCLAKSKIVMANKLPSFVIPGKNSYLVEFRCTPGNGFAVQVETPGRAAWIEGVYETMP